jgi:hypothetical protein
LGIDSIGTVVAVARVRSSSGHSAVIALNISRA